MKIKIVTTPEVKAFLLIGIGWGNGVFSICICNLSLVIGEYK